MLNDLTKEQRLIILGLVLLVIAGLGVMAFRRLAPGESEAVVIDAPGEMPQSVSPRAGRVMVHITGAVEREGVFLLKHGDRVIDALGLAGGATVLANLSSINLAEKVKDGQKINVPLKVDPLPRGSGDPGTGRSGISSGKVNINSADEKELCKITGIGPSAAKRIVEYRSANGPFSKVEDVMKVKGIGKGTFGKIKNGIII